MDLRNNNFDLLRFFAAAQVAFSHSLVHLKITTPFLKWIGFFLSAFPGVPIFFIISGFLITASYERNHNIHQYFVNRILRIYPALWGALVFSVLIIAIFGFLPSGNLSGFLVWLVCQSTLFQFYNPEFLREFGVGVVNGSLWTIAVELQFYILVPILYFLLKKKEDRSYHKKFFWGIFFVAICINCICTKMFSHTSGCGAYVTHLTQHSLIMLKLLGVTILPYLYCFIIGVLIRLHMDDIGAFIVGKLKFSVFLISYVILYLIFRGKITFGYANPLSMVFLSLPVISFAFSFRNLSKSILNENDFSYGIYVYHMLIVNTLVCLGLTGRWSFLLLCLLLTMFLAVLSWVFIERPALRFKSNSLRSITKGPYKDAVRADGDACNAEGVK